MSHLKLISFLCLIFLSSNLLADNHSVILIKNATIITASDQGTLENTDLLIEDGIIKDIGKNLIVNDGSEIDATGKFITPGLIAPHTTLGLQEIELEAETRDDSTDHYSAGFSIAKSFNPASSLIPYNRAGGITSAIVTPSSASGIFSGMASAFKINGALMTESIIEDIALVMNLGVSVFTGFTEVFTLFGKPFILKLTPKMPSPISFGTKILPTTGILEINLFNSLAGTIVPRNLIKPVFLSI